MNYFNFKLCVLWCNLTWLDRDVTMFAELSVLGTPSVFAFPVDLACSYLLHIIPIFTHQPHVKMKLPSITSILYIPCSQGHSDWIESILLPVEVRQNKCKLFLPLFILDSPCLRFPTFKKQFLCCIVCTCICCRCTMFYFNKNKIVILWEGIHVPLWKGFFLCSHCIRCLPHRRANISGTLTF